MSLKVFITGASSGIGEALAVYYAASGARLGLAGRRPEVLAALNQRLGGGHQCYALDVTDAPALANAAADFMAHVGIPDIVIASAGVSAGTLTEHAEDLAVFRRIMDINVYGMAACFAPFIPAMKQAALPARLVGIASVAGIRGLPGHAAYSASKAAAIAYCESLRVELQRSGVSVTSLLPGYVDTPLTKNNPYSMPFLLSSEEFAKRAFRVIERKARYAIIPWQMRIVGGVMRVLPAYLWDRLTLGKTRKPRHLKKD